MIQQALNTRCIPPLFPTWDRNKTLDMFQRLEYGYVPCKPLSVTSHEGDTEDCFGGMARYRKVNIHCRLAEADYPGITLAPQLGDTFVFDIDCYIPSIEKEQRVPAVIACNDREAFDFGTCPADFLCAQGFAVFNLRYRKIANDPVNPNGLTQFEQRGIDHFYYGNHLTALDKRSRAPHAPGVLALWAWGFSRVADYVTTLDFVDKTHIIGAGHSRIGKAVLLAGALDNRFACVYPNASCAGGVSLSRGCGKETLGSLVGLYPNSDLWFCDNAWQFAHKNYVDEAGEPFDQHALLACVAPRKVYVGNADNDEYCEAASEYLACAAANEVYQQAGGKGFIHPNRFPHTGDTFHEGDIGYHLRAGHHAFNRDDWALFATFYTSKMKEVKACS